MGRVSYCPKLSWVRRALGSPQKGVFVLSWCNMERSWLAGRNSMVSLLTHAPVPVWQQGHHNPATRSEHHLYVLAVSSSPPPVSACSSGTADGGRSRSLYLASLAVVVVVGRAGVPVCSPAPWDTVPIACSGQGPAEQPRTTMALGKCLQKTGFTCLRVSGLRQKSCRVWMPFPHEVEHCRGRNPQAFLHVFQLMFINKHISWHDPRGWSFVHWCCSVTWPFSALMAHLPEDLPNYIFELRNHFPKPPKISAFQKKSCQGPSSNCGQNLSWEAWEANLRLLNIGQWKG